MKWRLVGYNGMQWDEVENLWIIYFAPYTASVFSHLTETMGTKLKAMLIGEYVHTLDDKKRVSLPAKFRREVGKKVVITNGLDKCLFVYTMPQWEKLAEKLSELPLGRGDMRGFSRFMLSSAYEAEVDSLGRVLIPDSLKDFAELKSKIVIAGVYGRIEIWNEKLWSEYKANIGKQADLLAEKLGEIGAI